MSLVAKQLVKAIKDLADDTALVIATIKSVDKNANTCVVIIDGDELGDVRLQAVEKSVKGCRFYPAENSIVSVAKLNEKGEWYVALMSEMESVVFEIDGISLSMDANGIVLNGGNLGGLLKLTETVAAINEIKQDLNNAKTLFNSWVVVPSDGGAALKTVITTWASQQLTLTQNSDVENTLVKQ